MAFFCVVMLDISLELALHDPAYEDMASKFFEHFIKIVDAMNAAGNGEGYCLLIKKKCSTLSTIYRILFASLIVSSLGLWDEKDGFYYDVLRYSDNSKPLRVRSMVGLIPLYACLVLDHENMEALPAFKKRTEWFLNNRPDLSSIVRKCLQILIRKLAFLKTYMCLY